MASNQDYDKIVKKYQQMTTSRKESYDIDINKFLPSIEDMLKEDCVWDVLDSYQKNISKKKGKKDKLEDIAYYTEKPPITKLGYHEKEECFVLRANKFKISKGDWELGNITGDTWTFDLDDLNAGGSFTVNDTTYKTFKEYAQTNNKITCRNLQVRSASISASKICHYTACAIKYKDQDIKTVDYKTAQIRGYVVMPHKINRNKSSNPRKWTITNYKDNDKLRFLKSGNTYCQIIEDMNAKDYLENVEIDKETATYVIAASNEWGSETIKDGYEAQARVRELIEENEVEDIIVILDRNAVIGKKVEKKALYYNSFFFTPAILNQLIDDIFRRDIMKFDLSSASFLPFGCDAFGQMLGNVYVKVKTKDGSVWRNLSKYVLKGTDFCSYNNDFYDAALNESYGGTSDAFKQWTYVSDNYKYLDSLTEDGKKSYEDRIALHKKLTGIDFGKARDHTVLLGDTLFLIPPEAIHTSSTLDYEKLPIIRGKGSMMKNRANIEELIELELYFNKDYGINGIPYTTTTPSGESITYFMNGLRALVAQFRVSPFLPIENHYINDILNIEAVSLVNISASTVDGFPRLLKVILTLRDFNYRVFMPDLPLPEYDVNSTEISQTQPIFAQHFNWEVFRYYYQRGLIFGDMLEEYKYNSYNYKDFVFSHKNIYKSSDLTDSNFEFYIPDTSWLKYALQIKKARDKYGQVDFGDLEDEDGNKNENEESFIVVLNDNKPYFDTSSLKPTNKEDYTNLDRYGRCGPAFAILNKSMMPEGDRPDISSVNPSGWNKNKKYDSLKSNGNAEGYLYNRCHLIGYQLTGQGANEKNLITGTRYLNVGADFDNPKPETGGMLYYENLVANYLKNNPDKHVAYKVTPVFNGSNLVASAVTMEGYSIEDKGKSICFNVYIRNIQPGIEIEYSSGDSKESSTKEKKEVYDQYYDYKDPRNMKFVPYLQSASGKSIPIELDGITFSMSNYFTETYLKAVDGFAPQYMGGSDVSIELNMTLTDEYYVSALKNLPHVILEMVRNYRRVMPCFPLKIKNEYLQMIGVHEVAFDNISVSTKPGHPGVYSVVIKLTSMDRTMRQREALQKSQTDGMTSSDATNTIGNYFNLQSTMAKAELYPDLDLPTIEELDKLGWKFAKWANEDRVYVDPDFYMCYSFQYASKIIKEIINNVLYRISYNAGVEEREALDKGNKAPASKQKAHDINKMQVIDSVGIGLEVAPGIDYDGLEIDMDNQKGFGKLYDDIMTEVQQKAETELEKKNKAKQKLADKDQRKKTIKAIEYLTATGIEDGWQIAPGWFAPLCSEYINEKIENSSHSGIKKEVKKDEDANDDMFINEIYDMRHRALILINRILDRPLINSRDDSTDQFECLYNAVDSLFGIGTDGEKLLKLLCPMQYQYKPTENKHEASQQNRPVLDLTTTFFEASDPIRWLEGYLYALACVRSGAEPYGETKKQDSWQPQQWQNAYYRSDDKDAIAAGYSGKRIPYNKIRQGRGLAGDAILAETYKSWKEDGVSFGAGQLAIYNKSQIKSILQPESKINYFTYRGNDTKYPSQQHMYHKTKIAGRKRFCETGFIDSYYNYAGYKSKDCEDYMDRISNSLTANFEALLREVLMYLKYLIIDGYIFSEVDVIAADWDTVLEDIMNLAGSLQDNSNPNVNYFASEGNFHNSMVDGSAKDDDGDGDDTDEKEENDELARIANSLKEEIPNSYTKLFCARLIYPFALASCNGQSNIKQLFKDRDYGTLSSYTLSSNVGGSNESKFNNFLSAMYGTGMIGSCNVMDSGETTSNTQKAFNTLMSEAYTAMSEDPRCYALHSMYDMCVSDKRGRLLRAFPCYYILFVDEGRQIGTWKLFDNFYNMSSISNLQVVKSRKMPADTCTFTMSNMFMSYADTYDNTVYQQYVDVYGFGDVFASIFSPRAYVSKEDMIRQRKQLQDTTAIAPGVRIHVRMGYGSDGSRLPIVFNGKIAEVNCGEVVDIVAQGDGHELNNPLNALGELTAINLDESQGWFTLFKDIRGSLARGGQTPRNLLAKLATAQYGGAIKSIIREYTEGRFFYDNPFGLYHFGDKRFKDIFEDSEIVQNMYEVSNKTMLNGVNDLLDDMSTANVAPIINCNIQDKTMWEIGHLCANSGDDFYFAVRDFGLRSTMCLCKANHYYAYEYQQDEISEERIGERRKPFQQFHYYDSYNDIIYNSLKASETNMKTNAVGTWEGTDWLWGTAQQSVGPIYLDINIYPEYQKSMTVETGLISGGDGGIDIPVLNALAEKFNYDECQGRVNKSLAEKVTTNVLRQSVKDMYEGEICVIGDASLKPYDRVSMVDMYEDVSGDVEVETVIHSMNIETGFTTTFVPDVIVRAEHSSQEFGYQSTMQTVLLSLGSSLGLRYAVISAAKKGSAGLLKIGSKEIVRTVAGKLVTSETAQTAVSAFLKGFADTASGATSIGAFLTNPVAIASTVVAGAAVYMVCENFKEAMFRFLRNIQALKVFPVTKNGRLLIAGMAGHRGSVYGYKYGENAIKNSIQGIIMDAVDGGYEGPGDQFVNAMGCVFKTLMCDENYEKIRNKWVHNLGLDTSDDIVNGDGASSSINKEAFYQYMTGAISQEYTSRATYLAAMKTKPRIKTFNTSTNVDGKAQPRSSEVYLKYQIGGVHDLPNPNDDPERKAVSQKQLATNEKIKGLLPVEDDPDIKLALVSDQHPIIKKFDLAHMKSPLTFNLKMENENTKIRYIAEGNDPTIFDLPMVQEDAMMLIKLIINSENLKGKTVTFMSGTRVNSTSSWKSTGFWFSLSSDDMTALEAASSQLKKDSSWTKAKSTFAYKNTGKTIQYTVYAPIDNTGKTIYESATGDDEDE